MPARALEVIVIEWTPRLAVGIEEIDAQHQELFRRADRFLASLAGASRQEVGIVLSYLRLYCVTHFGAEESWMREVGFPGYEGHKAEHDRFVKDLLALSAEHERRGGVGLEPMRVGTWLTRWLEGHISEVDTEFARFLLSRSA